MAGAEAFCRYSTNDPVVMSETFFLLFLFHVVGR
jgi:hypothetical protein